MGVYVGHLQLEQFLPRVTGSTAGRFIDELKARVLVDQECRVAHVVQREIQQIFLRIEVLVRQEAPPLKALLDTLRNGQGPGGMPCRTLRSRSNAALRR